jgi:hypothetical protein
MTPTLQAKMLAEFIGTFALIFIGAGAGGTWSEAGRDARDACLGLMKTCQKAGPHLLRLSRRPPRCSRPPLIPPLSDLVRARAPS